MDDKNSDIKKPKGLFVVEKVLEDLEQLSKEKLLFGLNISGNVIINITDLIEEEYSADISQFRVLTSKIGIIVGSTYSLMSTMIFSDNRISSLEQVNLSDMLGLLDIDILKFKYLSKCTFHFNRLYNRDQLESIPSIKASGGPYHFGAKTVATMF